MSIKILADSACDLPLSYFEEYHITLIPLKVHLDDQEFEDLNTIMPKTVYDAMRQGKAPKTSQASPLGFEELFTNMAKAKENGIYIAFSSELSGTYQTAVMMRDQVKENFPDFDLTIIDSKCASLGYGLVVLEAAKLAKANMQKDELINKIQFHANHMEHLFTVDNLEYLARGGRISKTSAFVGGLLNIKPLLNVEEGKLIPLEKIRGKKKLQRRLLELMKDRGSALNKQIIGISHGDDEEAALEIKDLIEQEFGSKQFLINTIGSAIGSHSGPGTIAIFFLDQLPE